MPDNGFLRAILMEHGLWAALFVVTLAVFYRWANRMVRERLDDRQREIDRLAEENREYREFFSRLMHDTIRTGGKGQ